MDKPKLEFHRPDSGGWTVVEDSATGRVVYSGHSSPSDLVWDILDFLGVEYSTWSYSDREFEEKF